MRRYVVGLEQTDRTQVARVGGKAAHLGEPTMTPPQETSAVSVVRETTSMLTSASETGNSAISVEVRKGEVPKSDAVPHSDSQNQPAPQAPAPTPASQMPVIARKPRTAEAFTGET